MHPETLVSTGETGAFRSPAMYLALAASALLVALAIAWLAVPQVNPLAVNAPPLVRLMGVHGAAIAQLVLGVGGLALVAASVRRPMATPRWRRVAAFALAAAAGTGLLGFTGIAFSGYMLVAVMPLAAVAGLVLLGTRRPWVAVTIGATVATIVVGLQLSGAVPVARFVVELSTSFLKAWPGWFESIGVIAFAGVWLAVAVRGMREGRIAHAVMRARVPITIAAAACAVPYVTARASWLTPWPLFGSPDLVSSDPVVTVMGLSLGAAMAIGGVLTLGLILPWGERFPRWMGKFARRPVPIVLATVPATVVAALFTFGGVGLAIDGLLGAGPLAALSWTMGLVLPFWLWGPLLGLATWGYAMHRKGQPS